MKIIIITLMSMILFVNSYAQDSIVIHLWPGAVPGQETAKMPPKLQSFPKRDEVRLIEVTDPTITVFTPNPNSNNGSGILVCPGGAYEFLASIKEGYEIAHWLNTLGFTVFVLAYRVPNNRAGALQDAQRAMRVIRSKVSDWKIEPNKIGVMGFSAGGSLSARISTEYDHNWYKPVDVVDSFFSKPDFAVLIYPAYLDEGPNHSLTPELRVNHQTPPMFIFQTADDPYSNSSLVMTSTLGKAKVPVELHIYPKGGHGYGMRTWSPGGVEWPSLAAKWLKKEIGERN